LPSAVSQGRAHRLEHHGDTRTGSVTQCPHIDGTVARRHEAGEMRRKVDLPEPISWAIAKDLPSRRVKSR
jgi:hypothetical protein